MNTSNKNHWNKRFTRVISTRYTWQLMETGGVSFWTLDLATNDKSKDTHYCDTYSESKYRFAVK